MITLRIINGTPITAPINVNVSISPMIKITKAPNIHELLIFKIPFYEIFLSL